MLLMHANHREDVKSACAGDIVALAGLKSVTTGDTLSDPSNPAVLERMDFPDPVIEIAVEPKTKGDQEKMGAALARLAQEDPSFRVSSDIESGQTIIKGMGELHLDIIVDRLRREFKVDANIGAPQVAYRETITKAVTVDYIHKKQTGGAGQFAEVYLRVEPLEEENFEFVNKVFGGAISQNYMPAIEKGIKVVMQTGVIANFPVEKVRVEVYDGKEHPVDSKPVAFEIAGREAFKLAVKDAAPVLLEPIMEAVITVPESNMGDIMGDLNTRRARVQGMDTAKGRSIVTTQVPLAEMQRYTTDLRSMTGGRGVFTMEFAFYETVPAHIAQEVIDARQKELAAQREE
jgi:elongation factor G